MTKKTRPDPRAASAIDREIGARIRLRRLDINVSQEKLGEIVGVTFQQIQKYEKGVNRVSASTLIDIAQALQTSPAAFLPVTADGQDQRADADDPEARAIARLYSRLGPDGKRLLTKMARALLSDDDARDGKRG